MARVSQKVVEANALALLGLLDRNAKGRPRAAIMSLRSLERGTGLSRERVRRLIRLLADRGAIEVRPRFAEDGGGQPNAYVVTARGRSALRAKQVPPAAASSKRRDGRAHDARMLDEPPETARRSAAPDGTLHRSKG